MKKLLFALFLLSAPAQAEITGIYSFPEGPTGAVQFEKDGYFGGDSDFTFSTTTNRLSVSSAAVTYLQFSTAASVSQIRWADGTVQVSSPAAGGGGSGDVILASTQTHSGAKTFNSYTTFVGSVTVTDDDFTVGGSTLVVDGGKVGIGATTFLAGDSSYRLHVVGPMVLQSDSAWGGTEVGFYKGATQYGGFYFDHAGEYLDLYANNDIQFHPNGNELMRMTGGKLGVGTTAPATKIHMSSGILTLDGSGAGLRVSSLSSCDTIDTDASGNLACGTDGGGGGSGDVILASTQTHSGAKTFNSYTTFGGSVTVKGNGELVRIQNSSDPTSLYQSFYKADGTLRGYVGFGAAGNGLELYNAVAAGKTTIYGGSGGSVALNINGSGDLLYIASNGKVSIGNNFTGGTERLHIQEVNAVATYALVENSHNGVGSSAGVQVRSNSSVSGYMRILAAANTPSGLDLPSYLILASGSTASGIIIKTPDAKPILFGVSDAEVMRISTSGFVGIGASSPGFKVQVSSGAIYNDGSGAGIYTTGNSTATAFVGSGDSLTGDVIKRQITIVIDGGGSAVTTGAKKIYTRIPYNMTLTGWDIVADSTGSIVCDLWKDTYTNFPPTVADTFAGSEKPTLSSAQKATDASLTSMTTSLAAGDYIEANVDSATTVTKVIINLYGTIN